jgi:maltodextrin utilization protein YvdJ
LDKMMLLLADQLKKMKDEKKMLEDQLKGINTIIQETEQNMISLMVEGEIQNFNHAGTIYYLNSKMYASAISDKKGDLFQRLKDQGFGDLVQETVNANSLAAFVREQIEQNEDQLPAWLDGLVSTYEKVTVGMRRGK